MNKYIVKSFIGMHIDLSKIVAISDVYFIHSLNDRPNIQFTRFGFDIYCQLLDKPIHYSRHFNSTEYEYKLNTNIMSYFPITISGEKRTLSEYFKNENILDIVAVKKLQDEIDDLINQWKNINN